MDFYALAAGEKPDESERIGELFLEAPGQLQWNALRGSDSRSRDRTGRGRGSRSCLVSSRSFAVDSPRIFSSATGTKRSKLATTAIRVSPWGTSRLRGPRSCPFSRCFWNWTRWTGETREQGCRWYNALCHAPGWPFQGCEWDLGKDILGLLAVGWMWWLIP